MVKIRIKINNKMKWLGTAEKDKSSKKFGLIEINKKKHKGDKAELASTIKHEIMHIKHPNMTEAEIYKKTRKTKLADGEIKKLLKVIKNKK